MGELSAEARELYVRIARGVPAGPADGAALGELERWRLVRTSPDAPDRPVALDPRQAVRLRLDEQLRELTARAAGVAATPAVGDELSPHFERARWRSGGGSEFLAGAEEVGARICQAVEQAEHEVLAAEPDRPGPAGRGAEREALALARGVPVRVLRADSARDDPAARAWVAAMTARGVRVRTLGAPFQRCVVIDRRQAFVPDHVGGAGPARAAWHVLDRALVAFIAEGFENAWERGEVWHGEPARTAPAGSGGLTRRQREILTDTAAGVDQRLTARRLDIGLRTLTKELSVLRARWGAPTLAALAYQWALSPERRPAAPDSGRVPAQDHGPDSGRGSAPDSGPAPHPGPGPDA
ncbi:hypothetical protein NX801_14080 [Streptomyces sp. LP05-1]|uniref:HTH luxR-type domain-containing protein n=1 Tax=Streptomyces pyxinae TaxID=2970734 RepID=A0ABT2CHA0_9ACTN|nr:hypothetical protein [Streptomyces sp. LP05-1]MCS0636768.1 hypothetical protein [Streptomyces sp. LP05-1]